MNVSSFLLVFMLLLSSAMIAGCGGSGSQAAVEEDVAGSLPIGFDENGQPIYDDSGEPVAPGNVNVLPEVYAGDTQFSDPNVIVTLEGSAEAKNGATVQRVFWEHISGPDVVIPSPRQLVTQIIAPDIEEPTQVGFRLSVEDSQGRINASTTFLEVIPSPAFARVVGTAVEENGTRATINIMLDAPQTEAVTMRYRTLDGTAEADMDYLATEGEISFPPGETSRQVAVPLINSEASEGDEFFNFQVTVVTGPTQASNTGVVQIQNDTNVINFDLGSDPVSLAQSQSLMKPADPNDVPASVTITYESSNTSVATVDAAGEVTAHRPGRTVITAFYEIDGEVSSGSYVLVVPDPSDNPDLLQQVIVFTDPSPIALTVGDQYQNSLDQATVLGTGASTYLSSAPEIASVSALGEVTALAEGVATISVTVEADDNYAEATASYDVTVQALPEPMSQVVSFTLGQAASIDVSQSFTNPVDESGAPGTGSLSYGSSDESIATVSASGEVFGVSPGQATISVAKEGDDQYLPAGAEYVLTVRAPQTLLFTQPSAAVVELGSTYSNPIDTSSISGTGQVTYSSTDTSVATVDAQGNVSALQEGLVMIQAMIAADTNYSAAMTSYSLSVEPQVIPLAFLNSGPLSVVALEDVVNTIDPATLPLGQQATYVSSDDTVAIVDAQGQVSALRAGTVIISASIGDNVASYELNVLRAPQTIAFTQTPLEPITVNDTLDNPVSSNSVIGTGAISYASSAPSVATVDAQGQLVALSEGVATITATIAEDDVYASASTFYVINVEAIPLQPQVLQFARPTLGVAVGIGSLMPLDESGAPGTGDITFSSSDDSIATVMQNGFVTGVQPGDVIIRAEKAGDDQYLPASAEYTLNVRANQTIIFEQGSSLSATVGSVISNPISASAIIGTGAISYSASDPNIATVDLQGQVSALAVGTVVIRVDIEGDSTYSAASASYSIDISDAAPQTLSFRERQPEPLDIGEFYTNFLDTSGAPGSGVISFTSSDVAIATVSDAGTVRGLSAGQVTITASKAADAQYQSVSAEYTINVRAQQNIVFTLPSPAAIEVGTTLDNAIDSSSVGGTGTITYSTSDASVATVDSQGLVTGLSEGQVIIGASIFEDSGYSAAATSYTLNVALGPEVSDLVTFFDMNYNGVSDAGDEIHVPFNDIIITDTPSGAATANDFSLPVQNDSLGFGAFIENLRAVSVRIQLGDGARIQSAGRYSAANTDEFFPSAIDVSPDTLITSGLAIQANPSEPEDIFPGYVRGLEDLDIGAAATSIVAGDINRDGRTDIVVGNSFVGADASAAGNHVYLNQGAGVFERDSQSLGEYATRGLALADVNGDSYLDLIEANDLDEPARLYLNDGNGVFDDARAFGPRTSNENVVAVNLNRDGMVDLVFTSRISGTSIYLNDGQGNFGGDQDFPDQVLESGLDVAVADVDQDQDIDLVISRSSSDGSELPLVYVNAGNSGVFSVLDNPNLSSADYAYFANLDGNAGIDLVLYDQGTISMFTNDGQGNYLPTPIRLQSTPFLAVEDIDVDSYSDFITQAVVANLRGRRYSTASLDIGPDAQFVGGKNTWLVANLDRDADRDFAIMEVTPSGSRIQFYFNSHTQARQSEE